MKKISVKQDSLMIAGDSIFQRFEEKREDGVTFIRMKKMPYLKCR